MSVSVRRALSADMDHILALEAAFPAADRIAKRSLQRLLKRDSAVILLAEDTSGIIGAAVILFRQNAHTARLYSIAVSEAATGRGVGAALLTSILQIARQRDCTRIRLEVRPTNLRAQKRYAQFGFYPIGRKHRYYADGEDALRMETQLLDHTETP